MPSLLQPVESSCKYYVEPRSGIRFTDGLSQVSSRDDFTVNAFIEESR